MIYAALNIGKQFANFFDTVVNLLRDMWDFITHIDDWLALLLDNIIYYSTIYEAGLSTYLWRPLALSVGLIFIFGVVKLVLGRIND